MPKSPASTLIEKPDVATSGLDRLFPFLLLAITLAALVPALVLGASEFIGLDGYWHVFNDTQDRWKLFLFEYRRQAHPILYHVVLRVSALFGHSRLTYRSASIISGVVSVYLLGRIAGRLCDNKVVALLAAAAYGFSMVMIGITIDVRSYSLALVFVIAAFYYLIDFLARTRDEAANRSLILFGVFTGLGIASEYYAIFFFVACLGVLVLLWATHATFHERYTKWAIRNWYVPLIAFGLPFVVIAYLYLTHVKYLADESAIYHQVSRSFWTRASPRIDFVLGNLGVDLNFMVPIKIPSTAILFVVLVIFVSTLVYFGLFRKQSRDSPGSGIPGLVFLVLLAELIVLSQLQLYPLGGDARQQSIIFPFFTLAAFILLDHLIIYLRAFWLKAGILGGIAALIAANFCYQWQTAPRRTAEVFTEEYKIFEAKIGPAQALYVDRCSLFAYYAQTDHWKWKFRRRFREPERIDEYDLTTRTGQHVVLLRNIDRWSVDLTKPRTYEVMARLLREAHLASANIFLVRSGCGGGHSSAIGDAGQIRELGAEAGLRATSLYIDNMVAAITFTVTSR